MNKKKVLVLASLVALVALTGCQNSISPSQGGTLTVSMNDAVSRSLLPGISMNPASYVLAGTGPNSASFSQTVSTGSNATITDLAFGSWTVTATAKNSDGTAIGQGSGTITVLSNTSVSLSITVRPYDGFGKLALNVNWPAAQVQTAQIQSSLTPASGSAQNLSFTINGGAGTASVNANDVATGYHTLIWKLLDNGHLAIGAVEVVRIVKDQITSGTLAFANVNQATGTLEVNLTPDMAEPLEVTISGSSATKPANQSLSLSASVSNYTDNVTYVWYVNGDAVATGSSYSFDDSFALGYYRIDVTAYSTDGKRAGSATTSVQAIPQNATINPSSASIGQLLLPASTPNLSYAAYSPTMKYDSTNHRGLAMYRYGEFDSSTHQIKYTLGLTAFSATATHVTSALVVEAFPMTEDDHPGNSMPLAFDKTNGVFWFAYSHNGQVLRVAQVHADLSLTMGPELIIPESINGISPDPTTGKVLVFGYSNVYVLALNGLSWDIQATASYPQSLYGYQHYQNNNVLYIVEKSQHVFFARFNPGIVLTVKLAADGVTPTFVGNPVNIPENTDYSMWQTMGYDSSSDSLVVAYRDNAYSGRISVLPFTNDVLGAGLSTQFTTNNAVSNVMTYNPDLGKLILLTCEYGNPSASKLRTISVAAGIPVVSEVQSPSGWSNGFDNSIAYDTSGHFGLVNNGYGFYSF